MCMGKGKMCVGHKVAVVLVLAGALNWGLVGLFNFNLVNTLFGGWPMVERVIYVLVGVAAIMKMMICKCKACGMGGDCCKKDGATPPADGGSCCGGHK